ncbi:MAG: bacillithiol biosynthesis cysteine-adding enzyme BshC, partial [Ignavibacteriales bacterium]|nr:bacillithiol biosynthesis cysteine-adding enzyme BshC [Ignavibacteriales bacterium]
MKWIDYKDLPSNGSAFSSLFIDYVSDFDRVKKFYTWDFRHPGDWQSALDQVSKRRVPRSELCRILSVQNRDFHCGVKTLANIDGLRNDNSVAVVTGQQVGLFTGPLYTIYKTLTTLLLSEKLQAQFPDHHFVPVFWLEGEDHDYDEVGSIKLISRGNDLLTASYDPGEKARNGNAGPVGEIELGEGIRELFGTIEAGLGTTEFTPKVMELFRTAYQTGMTFNRAFVHLMNDLLEDSGLVFLNPHDPDLKKLLAPVFRKELEDTPRLCQLVVDQSVEVEKNYHAQVKPKPINLFLFHNGGRYLIEPKASGFGLKNSRQQFSREQLLSLVNEQPDRFSPNVVLRPICQDSLLPTLAYVAGPAEISYFAQLRPLYAAFSIPEPIIYPRASATIVEEKVEKVLSRYHLTITEFFRDVELVKQKVAEQVSDVKIQELFGGVSGSLEETLESLRDGLVRIDPTLSG